MEAGLGLGWLEAGSLGDQQGGPGGIAPVMRGPELGQRLLRWILEIFGREVCVGWLKSRENKTTLA